MLEIEHDKSVSVLFGAGEADAVSATTRCNVGGVGADGHDAILDTGQTILACSVPVHVIHVAVGRIILLENVIRNFI